MYCIKLHCVKFNLYFILILLLILPIIGGIFFEPLRWYEGVKSSKISFAISLKSE